MPDDRNPQVLQTLTKNLFGKLFGDKGYISSTLFETLFNNGIHLITGIRNNMKNRLMSFYDRIMLRKRSIIETINDVLKNICEAGTYTTPVTAQFHHEPHCGTCSLLFLRQKARYTVPQGTGHRTNRTFLVK
jgi:hypothetical protein